MSFGEARDAVTGQQNIGTMRVGFRPAVGFGGLPLMTGRGLMTGRAAMPQAEPPAVI